MQSDMKVRLGSLKRHCKSQNECEEFGHVCFWKIVFKKSLSKFSCVCLLLGKVVNGKYFPVKRKHFPVNGKHFLVKGKFDLVSRKVFFLLAVFVFRKVVSGKTFQTFMCLFAIKKVGQRKTLSSQRKIWLGFQESVFLENLDEKHFLKVVKNFKMSYYLLIYQI